MSFQAAPSAGVPFLPLAFRFAASFGLLVLHFALPPEAIQGRAGEPFYLLTLAAFFLESIWEMARAQRRGAPLLGTPGPVAIRWNLALDILLVALVATYQGVDQERFGPLYTFPVLASAFYLPIAGIVMVGLGSALVHALLVIIFALGWLSPFGNSSGDRSLETAQLSFVMSLTSLQVFFATLVVVVIRKHVETLRQTLRQSETTVGELSELYRGVFESMFAGLITTDLSGRVTSANPAAQSILKRTLETGTPLADLDMVEMESGKGRPLERRFERTLPTEDGLPRIIGGNVAPLRDAEGTQRGHLILFQDLTEMKALEQRTAMNTRLAALGELSAELAHELRNPMASILGCVQILQGSEQPEATRERVLHILQRESSRVNSIVTDFLGFARPRELSVKSLWLPQVIEDVRASWETDARSVGLELEIDPAPPLWISGDPVSVHQVFSNLLSNARKALGPGPAPAIRIRLRHSGGRVRVRVEDEGCGMDAARLQSLFIPFSSGFEEGTGLGMSVVFQLVQRMGWDIRVESEPGMGTQIHLEIPLAAS